ncbi:alpha/beta-hydrolase [Trametes meyenii]|nr:alpha/beta-hydrolase [Trametes meyenii]
MFSSAAALLLSTTLLTGVFACDDHGYRHKGGDDYASIEWGPCDPSLISDPALTCAFFKIPLDYHDPSAGHGRLALVKANATGVRRGTVFVNPGGPGSPGLDAVNSNKDLLLGLTGGNYDIVSWDPRGVGSLTIPGDVFCFDSTEDYNTFWNGTIELSGIEMTGNFSDPTDIDSLFSQAPIMQAKYDELAERCLSHPSGKFLKYVGSAATARDTVALADALDGPGSPINYIALSYGTLQGAWLVNMFPERVGRIVLDGVLNPLLIASEETAFIWPGKQLADADKVYDGFVTGCALAGPSGCAIAAQGQSAADVDGVIQALIGRAHAATRRNSSVPVTSADVHEALSDVQSPPSGWADFANTTFPQLVAAVDAETPVRARRAFGAIQKLQRRDHANDTKPYSGEAILCSDSIDKQGTSMLDVFKNIVSASRNGSELFTALWPSTFYYCPFWPVRAVERYHGPFNKTLANKVLIVNNVFDPATPVAGAVALAGLLGDSATLVRQNAFGHVTTSEPSQCLNNVIISYFTNGTLPEGDDTMCEVDADFEPFPGVNTEAILKALGEK